MWILKCLFRPVLTNTDYDSVIIKLFQCYIAVKICYVQNIQKGFIVWNLSLISLFYFQVLTGYYISIYKYFSF